MHVIEEVNFKAWQQIEFLYMLQLQFNLIFI